MLAKQAMLSRSPFAAIAFARGPLADARAARTTNRAKDSAARCGFTSPVKSGHSAGRGGIEFASPAGICERRVRKGERRPRQHDRLGRNAALPMDAAPAFGAIGMSADFSLSYIIAVVVGYMVVAGSLTVKLPQIIRILKKESAEGISLFGHITETLVYAVNFAYSFRHAYPFSSYGDSAACLLQNFILVALIASFKGQRGFQVWAVIAGLAVCCWCLLSPAFVSLELLLVLQASTTGAMIFGSRAPQIWLNFRRGNSGELSIITTALQLLGNLARVYTTIILTSDSMLLFCTSAMALCNFIIFLQIYFTMKAKKGPTAGAAGADMNPAAT